MGLRHKLIRISEKDLKKDAKQEMKDFIINRYAHGKDTKLQDIQDAFKCPPWELSEGSVINYLNELTDTRKLSTWKTKTNRYYGPPKIPLPIKVGIAISVIIIVASIIIDAFFTPEVIHNVVYLGLNEVTEQPNVTESTMLPLVIYLLALTFIFTTIWWYTDRKKAKGI
jgi:hypothetical protein